MRLFFIALLIFVLCTFNMAVGAGKQALQPNFKVASINQSLAKTPKPRKPIIKDPYSLHMPVHPIRGTAEHTGRLIVMYGDSTFMRAPRIAGSDIHSDVVGIDSSESSMLLAKYGCTIRQAIDVDTVKLEDLRSRANSRSGKSNPDLAAMMLIEGISPSQLLSAARDFLVLKDVAWVEIETRTELASPQACPNPAPICDVVSGNGCPDCGTCKQAVALPCEFPHPGQIDPTSLPEIVFVGNCSEEITCGIVVDIRPDCAVCWDQVCATLANLLGPSAFGGQGASDTCLQTILPPAVPGPFPYNCPWSPLEESILIQTSPFLEHTLPGSSNPDCCRAVCFQDVTCCTVSWDSDCAAIATGFYGDCYSTPGIVGFDGGSPLNPNTQTPSPLYDAKMLVLPPPVTTLGSFPLALYTTAERFPDPYTGPNPPPPPPLGQFQSFINVTGFRGGGLDLASMESMLNQFPGTNGPQLPTISVAVVEPSALVNHEDLIDSITGLSKVTVETGQTPLVILDQQNPPPTFSGSFDNAPSHGMATLGVLFANDNTIGVTGIIPEARAFFFPTESFEAQGRFLTATTNAIFQLSAITTEDPNPGNIIVMPTSLNGQPLNTSPAAAALITTGINLGVTFVLAAGNSSQEILPPVEGSEDAIVVGGVWPGFQYIVAPGADTVYPGLNYCRANLSNFSGEAPATVDVSGWGKGVNTLGYGDLFSGQNTSVSTFPALASYEVNRLRTYTAVWGGTSAAAAQVAGVAALAQALAKQVYDGQPYSALNIKNILSDPANQYEQCGLSQGNQPLYSNPFVGNTLLTKGDPSPVGGFPNLRRLSYSVAAGDFYDSNQSTFQIICGTLLSGSQFSIREIDNKFVKTKTARPNSNQASSGLGPALFYPTAKRVLDMQIIRTTDLNSPADLTGVSVRVTGQTISVTSALVLAYIYNYTTNRWNILPPYIGQMTGASTTLPQFVLPPCIFPSYVGIPTPNGTQLAARVVVIPIGGLGQAQIWLDQIEIMYNDPLSDPGAPCGQ